MINKMTKIKSSKTGEKKFLGTTHEINSIRYVNYVLSDKNTMELNSCFYFIFFALRTLRFLHLHCKQRVK